MADSIWLNIFYILQILFLSLGVYYFFISLFAFLPHKKEKAARGKDSFAIVVAAHNEQTVIGHMVESLQHLDYPKDKYEVFVVADNCTDSTAKIAKSAGATVFERQNKLERGKGYALEWMFDKIFNMKKKFDHIAIFDADNVVDKDFLKEMNKKTRNGAKVVQGYVDSKNPRDSWISYSYSLAFWMVNKLYQTSRSNLGLTCQLNGTGFIVNTDILKQIGWQATCLTEDMEFTMRLALNNIKVAWAPAAKIYDEKPITFIQSWKQRVRWMQGHADVASRFLKPLTKKALKEGNIIPFDCAIYLLQPLRIITMGFITFTAWLNIMYPESNLVVWGLMPDTVFNVFVLMQFLWGPLVMIVEKRFNRNTILDFFIYGFYSLSWIPIAAVGMAKKNQREWFHTQHTRTIAIHEMN
ncbi:MAG: glycosyltransferase [Oscillospiraceae bacterium]|nr:glycosyltransferase [Oscillospiraceae bacterium]